MDLILSDLPIAGRGRVKTIALPPDSHRRLLEMGLTRGAELEMVRHAPLGDPIEIKIRGYHLSLRRAEASGVLVEVTP